MYTRTNPISPFEYHNSLLLICLFEICDESAIFSRPNAGLIHTYLSMLRVELFLNTIGWMPVVEYICVRVCVNVALYLTQ